MSAVSQFMHAPMQTHLDVGIICYLKGCPGKGLMYIERDHLHVEAYTDADYAGFISNKRSTSRYCTFVGGNIVTWRSMKQALVTRFSAKADFIL